MQKLTQKQKLLPKLSPQQMQFIKLLQIPTAELLPRIHEEVMENPLLETNESDDLPESGSGSLDGMNNSSAESNSPASERDDDGPGDDASGPDDDYGDTNYEENDYDAPEYAEDSGLDMDEYDYTAEETVPKMQGDGMPDEDERNRQFQHADITTLMDTMVTQLGYLKLDLRRYKIGMQLIGSIESDGYIRRKMEAVVNDLAFTQNIETNLKEVEGVLALIQQFDPPGIAARDLQECLELQLKRKDLSVPENLHALKVVSLCFDELAKRHYSRIQRKLNLDEEELREAINTIRKLNPKPGDSFTGYTNVQYLNPDFIVEQDEYGALFVALNTRDVPELRISQGYMDMLEAYEKSDKKDKKLRNQVSFLRQKLDAARWFIDAIRQRQETLLKTMNAILRFQYEFFQTGEESRLKPMILKNIAEEIGMDISTVSRVARSKVVQTDFGIFPLKFFFSEGIETEDGEEVSSKEVKAILKEIIEQEDKARPHSDDRLEKMLNDKGYNIARRTVAKYREQLNIPVARLRKEI